MNSFVMNYNDFIKFIVYVQIVSMFSMIEFLFRF